MPSFITASTASGVATLSITQNAASLIIGISTRLLTKPGASFTATGFFSSFSQSATVVANVASLVCNARITSTSVITGTGFIKCMPINCSGRLVAAANVVIAIDEVFDARITPGLSVESASRNTESFRSNRSGTASTAKSARVNDDASVVT